jgi:hypothetical protein
MWTSIEPFYQAENAYRRERILATYPARSGRRPGRLATWRSGWGSRPAHHSLRTSRRSLRHPVPLA